jgi:hypothetical protein
MKNKEKILGLVVGDWSNDGHNMTCTIFIKTNLKESKITEAYDVGWKKLGVDFISEVAFEYEDNNLPREVCEKLRSNGFDLDSIDVEFLEPKSYAEIYLFIAKMGNPKFQYEIIEFDSMPIGGYGLFLT